MPYPFLSRICFEHSLTFLCTLFLILIANSSPFAFMLILPTPIQDMRKYVIHVFVRMEYLNYHNALFRMPSAHTSSVSHLPGHGCSSINQHHRRVGLRRRGA